MLVFDAMNCSQLDADYARTLRAGGVDAMHTSVIWGKENFRSTVEKLEAYRTTLEHLSEDFVLAFSVQDIERTKTENRIAVVLGLQNSTPTEDNEDLLAPLHRLGVRIVQLTYNERTLVGDGCTERRDAGLSDFGIRVVRRLNQLRIAIDVSHAGERTLMDAVSESRTPVLCSHANARAICDSPRNLSDDSIRAIAKAGGVIGINSFAAFVSRVSPDLDALLDHVDHVVRLVGPEHVGIGSDLFEGRPLSTPIGGNTYKPEAYPDASWARAVGLRSAAEMHNIPAGLTRRGYDQRQIAQIMGGNFLRLLDEIWGG